MVTRQTAVGVLAFAGAAGLMSVIGLATQAQTSPSKADALLEWPLPPGEQAYGRIDGKHLHRYVEEQAAIPRRYRDHGHPKFWGRIIGSSADAESAEWLANKFKSFGMSGRSHPAAGPQPAVVPAAVGSDGDGRRQDDDARFRTAGLPRGRAPARRHRRRSGVRRTGERRRSHGQGPEGESGLHLHDARRAQRGRGEARRRKGAVAIFEVDMLPGNMRYQAYPSNTKAPAFTVGSDDGLAVRDLIASLPPGQSARVKATLDVQMVPNLKTALVWGTLPGASDETIYIVAHRDGWFEASGDNAGGVAAMVGLAEYYAKIPQAAAASNDGVHRPRRPSQHADRDRPWAASG